VSNLTLACRICNEEKGNLLPAKWIEKLSKSRKELDKTRLENFTEVGKQLNKPLKDATAVNATRWYLFNKLKVFGLPLETGSGALTKMNRIKCGFEKQHYFDALCVGKSTPEKITNNIKYHVIWSYSGRGNRKMVRVDQYGFPLNHLDAEKYNKKGERKGHRSRTKEFKSFQTGDIVKANVTKGKKEEKYRGRIAIRHTGSFNIKNAIDGKTEQGISHKYCRILQKSDGWFYQKQKVS